MHVYSLDKQTHVLTAPHVMFRTQTVTLETMNKLVLNMNTQIQNSEKRKVYISRLGALHLASMQRGR